MATVRGSSSSGRGSSSRGGGGPDLNTSEGLLKLAEKKGLTPPKPNKIISGLRTVGGMLNVGTAAVAGATRGLIRKDTSVIEGIKQGVKNRETFGFSNIIKEDLGINPTSRAGKIAVGGVGLAADILFDPLTYLTFGVASGSKALKVGNKVLSATGGKLAQQATKEVIGATTQRLIGRGAGKTALSEANKIASRRSSPIINDLFQRATGSKGLTDEAFKQFLDEGVELGTLNSIKELGPKIIDKGGIKMFGKTLVSSEKLAKTPLGIAAKKLGETEIGVALKNTLGKTFVSDFGKNKKLTEIIDKAGVQGSTAIKKIINNNIDLFKGLNDDEMTEFVNKVLSKKQEVLTRQGEIVGKTVESLKESLIKESNDKFSKITNPTPEQILEQENRIKKISERALSLGDKEKARNFLSSAENEVSRRTGSLQSNLSKFETKIKNLREKSEIRLENKKKIVEDIISSKVANKTEVLQKRLDNILKDEIASKTQDLRSIIADLRAEIIAKGSKEVKVAGEKAAEVSKEEFDDILESVLGPKRDDMELLIKDLEKELMDESGKEFLSKPLVETVKLDKAQLASKTQKQIIDVQNSLNEMVAKAEAKINERIDEIKTRLAERLQAKQGETATELISLQNKLADKESNISRILGARREAKASQKGERLIFANPKIQELSDKMFEGKDSVVANYAKAAGIPDEDQMKFYIASMFEEFEDKVAIKNFARGKMSSPKLNFQKEFTGAQRADQIKNPFELYTKGQINIINDRIKDKSFKAAIRGLGKPIESLTEEAAKKQGLEKVGRKGFDGKRVEAWFPKEVAEELNKFMEPKLTAIDELARNTGYDWATGLFKSYVTTLFPGFHIRNITSNQFNNMLKIGMDVLNPEMQINALRIARGKDLNKAIKTKTGKIITLKEIRDQVSKESNILQDRGAFGLGERMIEEGKEKISLKRGIPNLNPLSRENVAFSAGQKIGSIAESQAKMVSVISAVMQGKSVKEGIKQAEDALFNYSKLTDFETSIMRRLIPFYTFGRKNFELQLKALTQTPGKLASQLKFFRGLSNSIGEQITEEDKDSLPDWVLQSVGIKAGANDDGQQLVFTGFGLPIEEFLGRFSGDKGIAWNFTKGLLTQTNPLIKYPMERATGQDFFRDKPITEIDNAANVEGMISIMPKPVADEFKDLIGFKEIITPTYKNGEKVGTEKKYVADPFFLHFFRNLPTARLSSTAAFMSEDKESPMNKALRFFTGVKGWTIDKERQAYFNELKKKEELVNWLSRMGIVGEMDIVYKKKELKDTNIEKQK